MKKKILRYLKHLLATIALAATVGFIVLLSLNGSIGYGSNSEKTNLDHEGPYVFFYGKDSMTVNYIRGNKEDGFYTEEALYATTERPLAVNFFPLDTSTFEFKIVSDFKTPAVRYTDDEAILAISDIESGFKTFRDFLIHSKVINRQNDWTFGKGHLVLVGDFVDRGFSTNEVLWFIYKLEQDAQQVGGHVHFILGNHELYNMQGKYQSASYKYFGVASILGKLHHNLYDSNSFIGRWMASKNTIEMINGHLFTHGGLHPDLTTFNVSLEEINQINRAHYYKPYFPTPAKNVDQLITSNKNGLCWYRGYFKGKLSQEAVDSGLIQFKAKDIVVGHSLQRRVKPLYERKVWAIDVKHPKDYNKNFPSKSSEGLFIMQDNYFRVLADGTHEAL